MGELAITREEALLSKIAVAVMNCAKAICICEEISDALCTQFKEEDEFDIFLSGHEYVFGVHFNDYYIEVRYPNKYRQLVLEVTVKKGDKEVLKKTIDTKLTPNLIHLWNIYSEINLALIKTSPSWSDEGK